MMSDHFDVFGTHDDEHGCTSDYWEDVTAVIAEAFAITHDDDELTFLLTDDELDQLSEDVDSIPPGQWDDAIADTTITPPF